MTAWMVIQAIYILLMPIVIISLCKNDKLLQFLSLILSSYLLGLIIVHMMIPIHINLFGLISVMAIALAILYSLSHLNILHRFSTIDPIKLIFLYHPHLNLDGLSVGLYLRNLNPYGSGCDLKCISFYSHGEHRQKNVEGYTGHLFCLRIIRFDQCHHFAFFFESGQTMRIWLKKSKTKKVYWI